MAGVGAGYSFLTLVLVRSASASCVAPASPIELLWRCSSFTLVLVRAQRVSELRRARIVDRVVAEVSTFTLVLVRSASASCLAPASPMELLLGYRNSTLVVVRSAWRAVSRPHRRSR